MAIPGVWLQQSLLFMAILFAIGVVPLIGWAVVLVAFPVLSAGMLWTAAETAAGRRPGVAGLFIGLRRHAGNLLMVGIFYLLGGLLAGLVGALVGGSAALTGYVLGALAGMGLTLGGVVLGSAVFMVLWVVLIMALWFAPSLVLFHDVAPSKRCAFRSRPASGTCCLSRSWRSCSTYSSGWRCCRPGLECWSWCQ